MANNTTTINKDPKASYTSGQKSSLPRAVVDKMKGKSSLPQSVVDRMKGKRDLEKTKVSIGVNANRYRSPIGPSNKGSVPGGAGIPALSNVRMKPTVNAPKATMSGTGVRPPSAKYPKTTMTNSKVVPTAAEITIPGGGLRTAKSKAVNNMGGGGLGVSTGKTTGSSATRSGTGGRTGGRGNAGPAGMGASGRGTGGKR